MQLTLTESAIQRVEKHADPEWMRETETAVRHLAATRERFTTDDVWARMERVCPWVLTHERRAMGAIMRRCATSGIIRATNEYAQSARAECHSRPVRVWESTVLTARVPF